jgi:serine phosphatase RsbU (regulator of sigma subunit)
MSKAVLRQLIGRQPDTRALVSAIAEALGSPVAIEDLEGRLLHGQPAHEAVPVRVPVTHQEASLGWVSGSQHAGAVAALLGHLVAREAERKALGAEVLHLYREINLIYSFSEKMAALLEVDGVARLTLQEARHLIVATDGAILLLDDESGALTTITGFGDELPALGGFRRGVGIIGAIAASGIGEIVNDVDADARRVVEHTSIKALVCAPLKVGERVIGVIALGSTMPMAYTAAELKLLNTLALQAASAIENARLFERTIQAARERERLMALHQEAELARARLESELTLAARIQAQLFPAEMPRVDGYELAARNRPARRCGGDYFDVLPTMGPAGDPRMLLCVADVAGKGLPAALVMSNMQATLRALLGRTASLPDLATHASDLLYAATSPEKYVTAALAELSPDSGGVRFVGAGHLDNLILRADDTAVSLASTGAPLGLLPPGLPYLETAHRLEPGDCLVLYSDGVTDAQNEQGEEFGDARLLAVLRSGTDRSAGTLIDHIFAALDRFAGHAPQFDDITLLVVRRLSHPRDSLQLR